MTCRREMPDIFMLVGAPYGAWGAVLKRRVPRIDWTIIENIDNFIAVVDTVVRIYACHLRESVLTGAIECTEKSYPTGKEEQDHS